MDGIRFQVDRGYRLDPPGHPQGVSCDDDGPMLGPVKLLVKQSGSFSPRPVEELNTVFSRVFEHPLDCSDLLPGLRAVAKALNDGSLPRAMIATQLMRLPVLDEAQARRAMAAEALYKASPDDPKHPGWPAGTPNSQGGKFRPKDADLSDEAIELAKKRLKRLIRRRLIRAAIKRLLNTRRILRLGAEAASNAVPGLDVVGDAAMAVDLGEAATEMGALKTEADAAFEFASQGPHDLESLRVSPEDESFSSFDAFKKEDLIKRFGPAGDGYDYHHIVEQGAEGDVTADGIQSTANIVRIPRLVHEEINSVYGKYDPELGSSLRDWLKGKPFEVRQEKGIKVLRDLGIIN